MNEEDLHIPIEGDYEEKKALLKFFKNDYNYLWIDEIYVYGFGSFYNNSIKVQGGDLFVCKGFYETKEDISEITVKDVLNSLLVFFAHFIFLLHSLNKFFSAIY